MIESFCFEIKLDFVHSPMHTLLTNLFLDIVARFLDINLTAVAGETVAICVKLEDATASIQRPVNMSIYALNGTAVRK